MNNIFLNDPLLYNRSNGLPYINQDPLVQNTDINQMYAQMCKDQLVQQMQEQKYGTDHIGQLDKLIKEQDDSVVNNLMNNEEYQVLSNELQGIIQQEIIQLVKGRLNMNQTVIKNIERQKELILSAERTVKNDERKNISELNDYMKNYSHLTYDEYRKIKDSEKIIVEDKNEGTRSKAKD